MGKILRGNVYVISNHQYDSLQDGFIETKDYMYKTERTKDEIEIGKELTHQIKPYQEYSTFSAEEYEQNQSLQIAGPILFVGFFIGIVFFVCAGSFLYFRLFSDLEDDVRLFEMIRKVGLTSRELSKVVTIRLALLFFVPIGVATLHGAVALTALGQMFEYSLFKENTVVLSIFIGIQVVYFLLIRSRYVKQLKEITYALNVFFNSSTKFSKKRQVLSKVIKWKKRGEKLIESKGRNMKATGVIRKVDELGRIVIPKELRDVLGIQIKSPLEIFVEADKIILQKYQPYNACQITGDVSGQNITLANGNITVGIEGAEYLVKEIEKFFKQE